MRTFCLVWFWFCFFSLVFRFPIRYKHERIVNAVAMAGFIVAYAIMSHR